ncbi:MAG: hypothetical protein ACR2F9_00480 [Longimicrobiaceae bacterium]
MSEHFPILEVEDERTPLADSALGLIAELFARSDRQPLAELRMELGEKRLDLLAAYDFHLLSAQAPDGAAAAVAIGVYLAGVNAGFVSYLAVDPRHRARRLGRTLRLRLIDTLRKDARGSGFRDLGWVLGEVRRASPWLRRLVRERGAIPFDLEYYHPGIVLDVDAVRWVLYRQPVGDGRPWLPAAEVRRTLFAIWRRVYRIRYPLERPGFAAMLEQLAGKDLVGPDPELHTSDDSGDADARRAAHAGALTRSS